MPKPRSSATFRQRAAGLGLGLVSRLFRWSPAWLAYGVANALTPLLVWMTKRRERRIAPLGRGLVRNQRIACRGSWNPEASRDHLGRWARHMTHSFVDFCRMPRMRRESLERTVDLRDLDQLRALQAEGRGVICASGHLGIWELCGHVTALAGLPTVSVSRPSRNPAVEGVLHGIRTSGGQQILTKWGVLWPLHKALKRGEIIGIAADEDASEHCAFAPFLGTLASTSTTAALLAQRTGSPIAVVSCNRTARGRFRIHVWDVIRVPRTGRSDPNDRAGCAITDRISRALSRAIQTYPEQWLWGSRRFATRPEGESAGADGLPPQHEDWPGVLAAGGERA